MSKDNKSEAEAVHDDVEALKAEGMSNADAVRKVAEERGKTVNAVRANIHQHRKKAGIASPGGRRGARAKKPATVTVEGAVQQATAVLQQALDGIDSEVQAAKSDLDASQARYDQLVESVAERKGEVERKIAALS